MKKILLASAATLALSFPAFAQNNSQMNQPNQQTQQQPSQNNAQQQQSQSNGQQQQAKRIDPQQLSKQQIRQVQQALNKQGFNAQHVDGIWGRKTADALRNYQKAKNLPGNGHLNQQTLAQLGVNDQQQNDQGTVGQGSSEMQGNHQNPQDQNNPGSNQPGK